MRSLIACLLLHISLHTPLKAGASGTLRDLQSLARGAKNPRPGHRGESMGERLGERMATDILREQGASRNQRPISAREAGPFPALRAAGPILLSAHNGAGETCRMLPGAPGLFHDKAWSCPDATPCMPENFARDRRVSP